MAPFLKVMASPGESITFGEALVELAESRKSISFLHGPKVNTILRSKPFERPGIGKPRL
jgi:hypothetical protein